MSVPPVAVEDSITIGNQEFFGHSFAPCTRFLMFAHPKILMKELIAAFPEQLEKALQIGQSYSFAAAPSLPANVVLTGLGGSGIGGSMVQNYIFDKLKVPFLVNKDYFLPA